MDAQTMRVMMSSKSHTWTTPKWFFDAVERLFVENHGGGFDLDAAASLENHLAPKFYTVADDALSKPWRGRVWCNPPYGDLAPKFILKAYRESLLGAVVAVLVPVRSDTKAWHEVVSKASEIRLIKGRLKFGESADAAPFPSALAVFKRGISDRRVIFWDPSDENLSFAFMTLGAQDG